MTSASTFFGVPTPVLPTSLLDSALKIADPAHRTRWYMCVIISLSSLNYPDVIPQVMSHFTEHHLPPNSSIYTDDDARSTAVRQIREGLIKSTGIVGAARTGVAMRTFGNCIPDEYREKGDEAMHSPRKEESVEEARRRGKEFWLNIYARNPAFDQNATVRASADYAFIIRGSATSICL
jgi:hypothetical protein